jgi:MarR family transcriptional regulator, lower aerobic nicotinate degradation pathway regulator
MELFCMTSRVPKLTDHLGYWLRQVSNHVSLGFARKLADKDVTVAEWGLMRTLYGKEPSSPSQLASEMDLTRGAVTRLADRLIAKALIVREANANDGRAQTLHLTSKAAALVPELAALADKNESECFACLSANDRRTLLRILNETVVRLGLTKMPLD